MEETSHYPLNLKMSDVFRKAYLDLMYIGFVSAIPDFQGVGRRRSSQDSLTEIKTVIPLHWHHGGRGRGKGMWKGRMVFSVN